MCEHTTQSVFAQSLRYHNSTSLSTSAEREVWEGGTLSVLGFLRLIGFMGLALSPSLISAYPANSPEYRYNDRHIVPGIDERQPHQVMRRRQRIDISIESRGDRRVGELGNGEVNRETGENSDQDAGSHHNLDAHSTFSPGQAIADVAHAKAIEKRHEHREETQSSKLR